MGINKLCGFASRALGCGVSGIGCREFRCLLLACSRTGAGQQLLSQHAKAHSGRSLVTSPSSGPILHPRVPPSFNDNRRNLMKKPFLLNFVLRILFCQDPIMFGIQNQVLNRGPTFSFLRIFRCKGQDQSGALKPDNHSLRPHTRH